MKFFREAVQLADVVNGVLGAGTVPIARFQRGRVANSNPANVTLNSLVLTEVIDVTLTDVVNGDLILMYSFCQINKSANAGLVRALIEKKSGTSTGAFLNNLAQLESQMDQVIASAVWRTVIAGLWKVTGSGTLVMRLMAQQNLGIGTCPLDGGQLEAWTLKGP